MPASSDLTRERILAAAERLFAEHGADGVSMRNIASAAGVTLALISYHFHSKAELYHGVFRFRIEPLSRVRLARLAEVMGRPARQRRVEDVIDALVRPMLESRTGTRFLGQLIARELADPASRRRGITRKLLDPVSRAFLAALEALLPGRSRADIHWAYHLTVGSMTALLANPHRVRRLSARYCDVDDRDAVVAQFKRVFAAALRNARRSR